jgi:hypothetical protein
MSELHRHWFSRGKPNLNLQKVDENDDDDGDTDTESLYSNDHANANEEHIKMTRYNVRDHTYATDSTYDMTFTTEDTIVVIRNQSVPNLSRTYDLFSVGTAKILPATASTKDHHGHMVCDVSCISIPWTHRTFYGTPTRAERKERKERTLGCTTSNEINSLRRYLESKNNHDPEAVARSVAEQVRSSPSAVPSNTHSSCIHRLFSWKFPKIVTSRPRMKMSFF